MTELPKTKVYIDGANMFYTQKKLGWMFDWKKVKKLLDSLYQILEIRFYIAVKDGDKGTRNFVALLEKLGFVVITKPLKMIQLELDGSRQVYKANFDVEITRDILLDKGDLSHIILFSGDSDFASLVETLKKLGKKVSVYSSRRTLAWELKLAVSQYVFLEDLKPKIVRKTWGLTR